MSATEHYRLSPATAEELDASVAELRQQFPHLDRTLFARAEGFDTEEPLVYVHLEIAEGAALRVLTEAVPRTALTPELADGSVAWLLDSGHLEADKQTNKPWLLQKAVHLIAAARLDAQTVHPVDLVYAMAAVIYHRIAPVTFVGGHLACESKRIRSTGPVLLIHPVTATQH